MGTFHFALHDLPAEAEALRGEVRQFLRQELRDRTALDRAPSWGGFDRAFSRKVGERGWIGMTWPKRYGGHERSALERYVVMEEMLAAGAPVSAHWVADRQSGPSSCVSAPRSNASASFPGSPAVSWPSPSG